MPDLQIQKRLHAPLFGLWEWQEADYAVPLNFQLDGARSQVLVEKGSLTRSDPLEIPLWLQFILVFENAPSEYVVCLKSRGAKSMQFAQRIYDYFLQTISRFEALLLVFRGARNLISGGIPSIHSFYDGSGWREEVTWQLGEEKPQPFQPRLLNQPRGKNPLFKHPQLVTTAKWRRLQDAINGGTYPSEDIVELHRLAGKVFYKNRRLAVVESAILIESKLKVYAESTLPSKGFSKGKIKDLRDELGFNTVLNLVLPLTLSKTESKRLAKWRPSIDRLRKLRNDIVHNNLSDAAINDKEVLEGIYAAIDLFQFIEGKLPTP